MLAVTPAPSEPRTGAPPPKTRLMQLAAERVERVEDVVTEGDRVKVRVLEIDKQNRISLEKLED